MSMHLADDAAGGHDLVTDLEGVALLPGGLGLALLGSVDEEVERGPDESKMRIVGGCPTSFLAAAPTRGPTAPEAAVIVGWGGGVGVAQRPDCSPGPVASGRRPAPAAHGSAVPDVAGAGQQPSRVPSAMAIAGLVHETEHVGEVVDAAAGATRSAPPPEQVAEVAPRPTGSTSGTRQAGVERAVVAGVAALRRLRRPADVQHDPWRASRVGATQSNWSTPRATASSMPTGSPTPIR